MLRTRSSLGLFELRCFFPQPLKLFLIALESISNLLESGKLDRVLGAPFRGRYSFVQLAAPSRTRIERYRELNEHVESLAKTINEKWGTPDYRLIMLHRGHYEPPTVFRYLRGTDLVYVSSLHDGMNLVAKEFVAARDDERGVLILSQFAGAAKELTEALIENPYDLRQASDAMAVALRMPKEEQRERLRAMRSLVADLNVYRWAGRMLIDAARLRRKDRLTDRLSLFPRFGPKV